jgi:hypothetical protein
MTRSASTEWWSRDGRQQAVSAQGESLDCLLIGEKTMKTLITIIRSVVRPQFPVNPVYENQPQPASNADLSRRSAGNRIVFRSGAAPPSWVTNSATVTDNGTNKSVTLPATNSPQFFRLRRP